MLNKKNRYWNNHKGFEETHLVKYGIKKAPPGRRGF
jgi:hypothetical protein